ncbi:hypothetical protein K474DRAFT_1685568 [Panus rudis PR-1116 ss-1]|nr:hypothetical protein K474DRAFT_1685568 [Panus rudis PR-1116 ss-1]
MSHDAHAGSNSGQTSSNSTWTEPPWSGWIETTGDALLILEAARRGLIPRVTRRLVDSERKMITSGSVFVFDEDESGIKRWTDGFFWSPSRILGNFLIYRETEKRGAGHRSGRGEREQQQPQPNPEPIDPANYNIDGVKSENQSLSRPKSEASRLGIDRARERTLVGSLTNSYKFKPGGMMKKTFSLTIGGVAQHLISYYKIEDVEQGRLRSPSSLPELASLEISPEYLDKTHFRNPPKVEIGVDGIPRYRGEADDIDSSPTLIPAPLALPYHDTEASSSKRSRRYDPYNTPSATKRARKSKSAIASSSRDSAGDSASHSYALAQSPSSPTYPDASLSTTTSQYASYGYYQMHAGYVPPASVYSPTPYTAPPVTATSPVAQSPSPPAQPSSSSHTLPPITYPGYNSDSSPPSTQPPVYPYYTPPHGYAAYPGMPWPSYPGYSAHSSHGHGAQSGETSGGGQDVSDVGGDAEDSRAG